MQQMEGKSMAHATTTATCSKMKTLGWLTSSARLLKSGSSSRSKEEQTFLKAVQWSTGKMKSSHSMTSMKLKTRA